MTYDPKKDHSSEITVNYLKNKIQAANDRVAQAICERGILVLTLNDLESILGREQKRLNSEK